MLSNHPQASNILVDRQTGPSGASSKGCVLICVGEQDMVEQLPNESDSAEKIHTPGETP